MCETGAVGSKFVTPVSSNATNTAQVGGASNAGSATQVAGSTGGGATPDLAAMLAQITTTIQALAQAIAGLQATVYEPMFLYARDLNAYRRFAPDKFVPVNTSWGVNNHSVSFRVPMGRGSARRVKHRIAGAKANPYVVMAAMPAGFHHGLTKRLEPTPTKAGNAGETSDLKKPLKL